MCVCVYITARGIISVLSIYNIHVLKEGCITYLFMAVSPFFVSVRCHLFRMTSKDETPARVLSIT